MRRPLPARETASDAMKTLGRYEPTGDASGYRQRDCGLGCATLSVPRELRNRGSDPHLYRVVGREERPMENRNRQVLLKRRPTGAPTPADFEITDAPLPDPAEGEVLVRGIYLSLDPYMRGRISGQRS